MGLTVSRKTAKNLAVGRKNCQILTFSGKKVNRKKFSYLRFGSVKILDFYVSCLVANAVTTVTHSILVPKTKTFGSGPAESYSANRKCLLFARGMS